MKTLVNVYGLLTLILFAATIIIFGFALYLIDRNLLALGMLTSAATLARGLYHLFYHTPYKV